LARLQSNLTKISPGLCSFASFQSNLTKISH
jgi:hypothetical protein